jgi:serine protease Do
MNKRFVVFAVLLLLPLMILAGFSIPGLRAATVSPVAALNEGTVLDTLEATLENVYNQVSPSVVNIRVVQDTQALSSSSPQIPGLPLDPSVPQTPFPQQAMGSGFVWDKDGHIVTNNHVVEGASKITVTFPDNTTVPASVVGTDPHSDLAVIKVDLPAEDLHPVLMADSTQVRVGQLAVAIGNPFGLDGTMTVGFISALGRSLPVASSNMLAPGYTIPDIIQTDAPINPGNSGGVLVNDEGQVVGVPTAIESPVQANAGIGFAVPAAIVQQVVPALIRDGKYEHAWLGISGMSLTSELAQAMDLADDQRGVLVAEVVAGGPADAAGLRGSDRQVDLDGQQVAVGGDVIVAINDQPVAEFEDLVTYLARSTRAGDTVELTIVRDGREQTIEVTLAARPADEEKEVQVPADTGSTGGGWLGIQGLTLAPEMAEAMDLTADQQGVLVVEVVRDTPADEAGLRGGDRDFEIDGQQIRVGGDVIVAADGTSITRFEDLVSFLQQAQPEQKVTLTVLRDGEEVAVDVILGERPVSMP